MDFFALDIGTVNIKVVRLSKTRSGYKLEAASMVPTPVGGMLSESDASVSKMADAISKAKSDTRISTKNVIASLPESEVFTRIVTMPKMSMGELETAISWEAEQYIPLPLADVNFAYSVVDIKPDGSLSVMIVAAPKRLVEKYERVLSLAGLNPLALETELLAAARCLSDEKDKNLCLVVDCGARTTDMAVMKSGNVVFTRSIATAGEALTRSVMTNLQLDENQAEAFKRSYGMLPNQLEGKVSKAMQQVVQLIGSEITRTIAFFESHNNQDARVSSVKLVGGTSLMPEFVSSLATMLNVEVQAGNPGAMLHDDKVSQVESLPMYSVAIGLAMKDI